MFLGFAKNVALEAFVPSGCLPSRFRNRLLRALGAQIGKGSRIESGVLIKRPCAFSIGIILH